MLEINLHEVIYALSIHFKSHEIMSHNTYALQARLEADFLSVTKSGYVHEVEIKISKSDFKADFKKVSGKTLKHDLIKCGELANYFWFCTPLNLLDLSDIPDYCGLIEFFVDKRHGVQLLVRRNAPKIHANKVKDSVKTAILRSMYYRAWTTQRELAYELKKKRKKAK